MSLFYSTKNEVKRKIDTSSEYLRNEVIFKKNSLVKSLAIVKRGSVAIMSNNIEVKKIEKNAIIGLSLFFSSTPFYDYDYIALTNTTLEIIYKDNALENLKNNKLIEKLADYSLELEKHNHLLLLPKEERVRVYLGFEAKAAKSNTFYIAYTKNELAAYLNIPLRELTIIFKNLKDSNLLANENKLYILLDINHYK